MPYLPPAVIGLLLAFAALCGVLMMLGIRLRMRSQLEPLSRRGRRFLLASVLGLLGAAALVYHLARLALRA